MDKEEFIELTGEDPEDMFGPDWENEVNELMNWLWNEHKKLESSLR